MEHVRFCASLLISFRSVASYTYGREINCFTSMQHDFIILPCDFIPPPGLSLSTVLNRYRLDSEMMISTLFYEVSKDGDGIFADEAIAPPLVAYDTESGTLLGVDYNLESEGDELELHMRLLWK